MAKGHFQACALSHFWAFLLPAVVVEVAVAICLKYLILTSSPGLFPNTGPYTEKEMATGTSKEQNNVYQALL